MSKGNAVALKNNIDSMLKELAVKRTDEGSFIKNKVDIVADLIIKAHKKECTK